MDCWGIHFKALMLKEYIALVQFSSVTESCSILLPYGLQHARPPVHLRLPEFTQTHVHRVIDAIQPSHPRPSPSPPAFSLFQHQDLFKWVSSLHQVANVSALASVLPMNIHDWFPCYSTKKGVNYDVPPMMSPFRKPCVTCLLALFIFSGL